MKGKYIPFLFILFISGDALAQELIRIRSGEGYYSITSSGDSTKNIEAEKKFALVVGNNAYQISPLNNAANDANDLSSLLEQKGFQVIKIINGTRKEMREAVRVFSKNISSGGIGLFYYSGHGVQLDGENYLIPIDAGWEYKEEVGDQCVSVSSILKFMETSNNHLNIMILDACRNSPFKAFSRGDGENGMVKVDAPLGTIVAYSTAPGKTASDGDGRNGLYTAKLMKYMNVPGMKIEDIFKRIRIEVSQESNQKQVPWESNSLMGDFYFSR